MRWITLLALAAATTSATGCATILKPKQTQVTVTSMTPGAQILVDGMPVGVTPAQISVSHKSDHVITVRGENGEQACRLESNVSVGWVVLDILASPAWIVDLVTGDWKSLSRVDCMTPI